MKPIFSAVTFIIIILMCNSLAFAGQNYSTEHQMAIVNAGHFVKDTDVTVYRFRYLLTSLKNKTGYAPQKIADMIAKTRNLIKEEYGRDVKLLDITEAANKSEAVSTKAVKLEFYLGTYAVLAGQ
jgi:hypothetical protein